MGRSPTTARLLRARRPVARLLAVPIAPAVRWFRVRARPGWLARATPAPVPRVAARRAADSAIPAAPRAARAASGPERAARRSARAAPAAAPRVQGRAPAQARAQPAGPAQAARPGRGN